MAFGPERVNVTALKAFITDILDSRDAHCVNPNTKMRRVTHNPHPDYLVFNPMGDLLYTGSNKIVASMIASCFQEHVY